MVGRVDDQICLLAELSHDELTSPTSDLICISDMNIRYSYRICMFIVDSQIGCVYPICTSEKHMRYENRICWLNLHTIVTSELCTDKDAFVVRHLNVVSCQSNVVL